MNDEEENPIHIPPISESVTACRSCNALWSIESFTAGCEECGGGGMTRKCPMCDGACGAIWRRAITDSWDSGEAHWVGSCTA